MDIQEVILRKQIDFNNEWPKIISLSIEATQVFENRLRENKLEQLLEPIKLDKDKALAYFMEHKDISKIFSSILDSFDMLPMHPDFAFDVVWRALEISLKYLSLKSWSYSTDKGFDQILKKGCEDVIAPYCNNEEDVRKMFEMLFSNVSLASLRYLVARLFFKMELSVSPQIAYVRGRAEQLLGKDVLGAIHNKYVDSTGDLNAANQHKAACLIRLILQGRDVDINGVKLKSLDLSKRVEFYVSCVLYSSRCERFHGDHYSPLKSSLADLGTYYEYYYFLIFSYALWGLFMNKIQTVLSSPNVFDICAIYNSLKTSLDKLNVLPNK